MAIINTTFAHAEKSLGSDVVEDDDCKANFVKSLPPRYSELATIIRTNDSLVFIDSICYVVK